MDANFKKSQTWGEASIYKEADIEDSDSEEEEEVTEISVLTDKPPIPVEGTLYNKD